MTSPAATIARNGARAAFGRGLRDGLPFLLVVVPFGALFGVTATAAGLDLPAVMGFSVFVVAGASQFVAVQMLSENAPVLVVIASALMVNLRMAMYSAALTPHLGGAPPGRRALMAYLLTDQAFAAASMTYEQRPAMTPGRKAAYYFGVTALVCPLWYAATWAGAVLGAQVPPGLPLDFTVPIAFLSMLGPMLRTIAHWAAAAVSVVVALAAAGLPWNLGLMLAAVLAMAAGAGVELWQERRRR